MKGDDNISPPAIRRRAIKREALNCDDCERGREHRGEECSSVSSASAISIVPARLHLGGGGGALRIMRVFQSA